MYYCGEPIFVDFMDQPNDEFMNPMKYIVEYRHVLSPISVTSWPWSYDSWI